MGSVLAPFVSDYYGRRMVVFLGGLLASLGAALQGGAVTIAMLIAGRFIAGIAIGQMSATIPVYCVRQCYIPSTKLRLTCSQSEVAPPQIRGLLASMQQWMIGLGIMVAVSTCTYLLDTHTSQLTTPAMGRIRMFPPRRSLLLALPARLPSSPSLHPNLRHLVPPRIPTMAH